MTLRPALLGLACLLSACAVPAASDEDIDADEADLVSIAPEKPIAVHVGFLQDRPAKPNEKNPNGARTKKLRATNVENVLVVSQPASSPEAKAWGGRLAFHLPTRVLDEPNRPDTVLAHLGDLVAYVRGKIADGYAYVAIDEIEPRKADFLKDSDPRSAIFVSALAAMHADPTLRQRIILYVNAYNMAGPNFDDFASFRDVLRACRDTCRVLAAELYLGTGEAFVPGRAQKRTPSFPGGCATGVDCIGYVSARLDRVAPGIAKRTITVLGVSESYEKAENPDSYCGGRGALRAQMAKIRELGQPGVGTYSLAGITLDVAKQNAFATCMHGLVASTRFPNVAKP